MLPRIITRTHYQVDEPAYLRILIRDCSSPIQSDYPERLAGRLEERLKALQKGFNLAAAKYCVDLARELDLLTENNFWTWSAHILRLISEDASAETKLNLNLSLEQRIFFFRIFLEFDGAALLFFARKLSTVNTLPEAGSDWNDVANEMMEFSYKSYLEIATDIRDRAEIRQLLAKRERQPYQGKSGSHQCFVHLNTMERIGLLQSTGREYSRPVHSSELTHGINRLLDAVRDVATLENIVSRKEWPKIAATVFQPHTAVRPDWTEIHIFETARALYKRVMSTGVTLCSLNTLIETIQIRQIAEGVAPISYERGMTIFRHAQAQNPKAIRFNVDRIGRPAFITFS